MAGKEGSQRRPVDQTGLPQVVAIEQEPRVYGEPTEDEFVAASVVEEGEAMGVGKGRFCPQGEGGGSVAAVHGDGGGGPMRQIEDGAYREGTRRLGRRS